MPLCENITSSTKSEVHNVSQHGKKRTKSRPCSDNRHRKFGEVRPCGFWGMQRTDRHSHYNISPSRKQGGDVFKKYYAYYEQLRCIQADTASCSITSYKIMQHCVWRRHWNRRSFTCTCKVDSSFPYRHEGIETRFAKGEMIARLGQSLWIVMTGPCRPSRRHFIDISIVVVVQIALQHGN